MQIKTIDLNFRGTPRAIAAYLVLGSEPVLVETGPGSTTDALTAGLAEHGCKPADVKHVLVTHIHLDHAGALGWWAAQGARVYVHEVGAPHVIDPSRLLRSATRIYGDNMQALWGDLLPVPAEQLQPLSDGDRIEIGDLLFTAIDTPGHATHHHVLQLGDVGFAGDAVGIRLEDSPLLDLPAPPPEFDLEVWLTTLDRIEACNFKTLYPTHFGRISDVPAHLDSFRRLMTDAAGFIRNEMQQETARDEIVQRYIAWHRDRALGMGVSEEVVEAYAAANPAYMSVDGMMRYWSRRVAAG